MNDEKIGKKANRGANGEAKGGANGEESKNKINFRVRDHCQVTGKYRGAAHKYCNLKHSLTCRIPVVFHNLKGHDSHTIMQQIGQL